MNVIRRLFNIENRHYYADVPNQEPPPYPNPPPYDRAPEYCQRCEILPPEIRVHYKKANQCEFICYPCLRKDNELSKTPVKRREEVRLDREHQPLVRV